MNIAVVHAGVVSVFGLGASLLAAAQTPDAPPDGFESDATPAFSAGTATDRVGRITVPILINGRGPYRLIVDTGASGSALAPRVVADLGLVPDHGHRLMVRGATGTEAVPTVRIRRLEGGELAIEDFLMPVSASRVFADSDGLLGVEAFEKMCLIARFDRKAVHIIRNGCPRSRLDWPRVPAVLRADRLIAVKARIRGVDVDAIIDTGAERTLGNLALLDALDFQRLAGVPASAAQVLGATSQLADGSLIATPMIRLGGIEIAKVQVTFGDFEIFRIWNLLGAPAIALGVDVLGTVDAFMIDYRRAEFRVLPRGSRSQGWHIRRVQSPSRIR